FFTFRKVCSAGSGIILAFQNKKSPMRKIWLHLLGGLVLLFPILSFQGPHHPQAPMEGPLPGFYPKDYFRSPVDAPIRLNGTFGELRPDHFHAGIDIDSKTGGIGQPVLAAAEGYVEHIRVQSGGYGNALYIRHPNGFTTLYGHLDRFAPEIQKYVRLRQYKRERFEVYLHPPKGLFPVKKGQEIAKLGNTGHSGGPHLHFEIRNAITGKVLNPLLFGLPVTDQTKPEVRDMKVYFLNERREVQTSKAFPIEIRPDGSWGVAGDTVRLAAWRVGFGIKAYDRSGGFRNDNGIFALRLFANDQLAFEWKMDELAFDESRYLNAHVDYPARQQYGAWFHRCFRLPGDYSGNYTPTESLGAIALSKDQATRVTVQVADPAGNLTNVTFWALRADPVEPVFSPPYQYELPFDQDNWITADGFAMVLPNGALYETLPFQYKTTPDESQGVYSPMHHLQDGRTPVQRYFEISLRSQNLPAELYSKACIVHCDGGRPANCGGQWRGDMLVTKVREFGDYCIMADTEPPRIIPVVFSADMRRKAAMSFRIRDNFGVGGSADGMTFRGTVDGKWILFEYDRKSARLRYTFDSHVGPGMHTLVLKVKDDLGNEGVFRKAFRR
ncbi:MAG: M23 family metallopeptidase, partial [Saprospiraceae bacterium]